MANDETHPESCTIAVKGYKESSLKADKTWNLQACMKMGWMGSERVRESS